MMNELAERIALWCLVREALPLARKALLAGGIDLLDQQAFWVAYGELENFADIEEGDEDSPSGIPARIEELHEIGREND